MWKTNKNQWHLFLGSLRFFTLCIPRCRLHCWLYSAACCTGSLQGDGSRTLCSPRLERDLLGTCKPCPRHRSPAVASLQGGHWDSSSEEPPCSCSGQKDVTSATPGLQQRLAALWQPSVTIGDLQSPSREPTPTYPFSNTELPFGTPQILTCNFVNLCLHVVSGSSQNFFYIQPHTSICSSCWRTLDLDMTIADTHPFSPKEEIVDTFFMKKRRLGSESTCLMLICSAMRPFRERYTLTALLGANEYCLPTAVAQVLITSVSWKDSLANPSTKIQPHHLCTHMAELPCAFLPSQLHL